MSRRPSRASRSSRPARVSRRLPRRFVPWFVGLNLAVAALLGGWYVVQPGSRQAEVQRLVANAFERDKGVTALDIAWDIWQLYYADSATGTIAAGDKTIVYGGVPQLVAAPAPANSSSATTTTTTTATTAPGSARSPSTSASSATTTDARLLTNRAYAVGYSDARGNPLWAAYRVQDLAKIPSSPPRPEKFETDRRTVARIAPEDYSNSGYDRGHLAPNYAIATRYGTAAQEETFLMSNITPQRHALNAGLWRELEMKIATSYPARYGEVWVLTGPVFGANPQKLRDRVQVPEAFFLIVIDENEGKLRTLSFLVPQETSAAANPEQFLTSIEEIQRRTGLDFLRELDDPSERAVEAQRAGRVW